MFGFDTDWITGVLVPVTLVVAGWLGRLQKSVTDLRILMAENYVKGESLDKALEPIHKDLEWTRRVLIRIADKLNVEADR